MSDENKSRNDRYIGPPCANLAFETSPHTIIYADVVIYGPASIPPLKQGIVILEKGRIVYVGSKTTEEAAELLRNNHNKTTSEEYHVPCVMPGMWDVHSHFLGAISKHVRPKEMQWCWTFDDRAVKVGRDVPRLSKILGSGFTSVREVGGLGKHLKVLVEEGAIVGPRIYHANHPIHMTGGHCDLPSEIPTSCFRCLGSIQDSDVDGMGNVFTPGVDGTVECVKAVRKNIRTGASVIKLCCSGGVVSQTHGLPTQQQFSEEEILAMTQEAKRHDMLVTAHCHSKDGILAAIRNGVQCIEHCTLADDECIQELLEYRTMVVPTRWVIEDLVGPGGIHGPKPPNLSELTWEKVKMIYEASRVAHRKAIQANIPIAVGCDIFVAEGYGTSGKELIHLVDLGMSPAKAIEAATVHGPCTLGPRAPKSGQLQKGYDADIICLDSNPMDDITILADPQHIVMVFKGGILQKQIIQLD